MSADTSGHPPILLFSGGLDSLALWHLTGRPTPVYVRVGAPYERQEVEAVMSLADRLPLADGPYFLTGPDLGPATRADGHITHRNLLLAATAAAHFPHAPAIILGALLGEASPDKSPRFLRAASAALSASEAARTRLVAPARRWTKTGLLRRFLAAHPGAERLVEATRSCYRAGEGECGECQACFRRHVALWHNHLTDTPPRLPPGLDRAAAVRAARTAGPARWPALAANNTLAALAVAGRRRPR